MRVGYAILARRPPAPGATPADAALLAGHVERTYRVIIDGVPSGYVRSVHRVWAGQRARYVMTRWETSEDGRTWAYGSSDRTSAVAARFAPPR